MKKAAPPLVAALLLSGAVDTHERVSTKLAWHEDIARIVDARCASCHSPSRADLPVTIPDLSTYASARPWARAIREAILEGHGYSAANGGALTVFERELLVRWIDGGAPEKPNPIPVEFSRLPSMYRRIASPDPVGTLEAYQARLGGTRAIVPGLGLTLRTPGELIVVERAPGGERLIARGTIVPSLAAHLASLPSSVTRTRISDAAYAVGPLEPPRVEIAQIDEEGPDRFWCPMHPDVRRPGPGACSRCGMALVEIPPLSLDPFALDVVSVHRSRHGAALRLRIRRGSREPVTTFLTVHERPLHLFVVDSQLETFRHVHPELRGGDLYVTLPLPPAAGRYHLIADFAPVDALPQMRVAAIDVERQATAAMPDPASRMKGTIALSAARKGRVSRVAFDLIDWTTGRAPSDLEPYLGAPAHLFVIDAALKNPIHAHPIEVPDGGMARPAFEVRFPTAGRYVMWLQVQRRGGRVETLRFTADVSS